VALAAVLTGKTCQLLLPEARRLALEARDVDVLHELHSIDVVAKEHSAETSDRWMTVAEVAELMNVSARTVYRDVAAGVLSSVRVGKHIRVLV